MDPETARLINLLDVLVRASGKTKREIEKVAGFSSGVLNRLYDGTIELKFRHLWAILKAIEISPTTWHRLAYELDPKETLNVESLLPLLRKVGFGTVPIPSFTEADAETLIRRTIEKLRDPATRITDREG